MNINRYIPVTYIIADTLCFGVTDTEEGSVYPFSTRETAIDGAKHMNVGRTAGFAPLNSFSLRFTSNFEAIR
jgi:hypothetical protein